MGPEKHKTPWNSWGLMRNPDGGYGWTRTHYEDLDDEIRCNPQNTPNSR